MANVGAEGIVNMVGGKAATGLAQGTRMAKPVIGKTLGAASEVTGITPAYMMGNNTKVN